MKIKELKLAINALSEAQKIDLFERIALSELNSRIIENNITDEAQFSRQFKQELTQEMSDYYKVRENKLLI